MASWFISDLHIKDVNDRQSFFLLRFFDFLLSDPKPESQQLFLVGDVFDFWLSDGKNFEKSFATIVDKIKELRRAGVKIFYFEGNHDFHIDVFWTKKIGIPVYETDAVFQVGNFKVRVEHGDFINPADKAYLNYRKAVRNPAVELFAHTVPGFIWENVGQFFSAKSRLKTQNYHLKNADQIRQMIRTYAKKVHQSADFDIIITGHMHVDDDYTFKTHTGAARSINLGTWLDRPKALRIDGGDVKMMYFNEQGELL